MQIMETNCQTCPEPVLWAESIIEGSGIQTPGIQTKESKLKLSLETRQRGEVMIVHCQGRIVYREEANALSSVVGELLQQGEKVILDLSGVSAIDSAGIGELVLLHTQAQERNAELKYANPRPFVRELFELTQVASFLEIHSSVGEALAVFQSQALCAEC
jgi:anti-sigma B factor antagonist